MPEHYVFHLTEEKNRPGGRPNREKRADDPRPLRHQGGPARRPKDRRLKRGSLDGPYGARGMNSNQCETSQMDSGEADEPLELLILQHTPCTHGLDRGPHCSFLQRAVWAQGNTNQTPSGLVEWLPDFSFRYKYNLSNRLTRMPEPWWVDASAFSTNHNDNHAVPLEGSQPSEGYLRFPTVRTVIIAEGELPSCFSAGSG